jgi:predicted acylesterase/phospholipase RssA
MYANLSISGGAHLCVSFLGFLRKARPALSGVVNVSGASAGALIAAAFVLDVPDDDVLRIIGRHADGRIFDDASIATLLDGFGMLDAEERIGPLASAIVKAGMDRWKTIGKAWWDEDGAPAGGITMLQLAKTTGKNLAVMVADASSGFDHVFVTADSHPDLPVVTALCASCAIPLLFTPVSFPGDDVGIYVDGCASKKNNPSEYFDRMSPAVPGLVDTLCVEVDVFNNGGAGASAAERKRPASLAEYGKALVSLLAERISSAPKSPRCRVHVVPRWTDDRVTPLVVGMRPHDVTDAYQCGMRSARELGL